MYRIRKKKGLSEIVTSVILTGIMLSIALIAMGFANNMFAIQSESTEFDQAKNIMTNLAEIIEHVSTKQDSSGYVKFNSRTGGPSFVRNVKTLTVSVQAISGTLPYYSQNLFSVQCNQLKYRGGSLASVAGKYFIRGTEVPILSNNNASMGCVFVEQSKGAWIVIDYSRVNVLNLGTFNFSKGINATTKLPIFELVNIIQVNYINLVPGTFSGSGNLYVVAKCKSLSTSYYRIPAPANAGPLFDKYTIRFSAQLGSSPVYLDLVVPSYYNIGTRILPRDTIIMFVQSNVEISVFG
ncbi:MAG: hypothetical protein N3F64_05285 [Nitrososphaeria archaeon]|nr:hypothetical protein [Nitrososphaeria archaeon]